MRSGKATLGEVAVPLARSIPTTTGNRPSSSQTASLLLEIKRGENR
jgi:hypothetical protein